MRGFTRAIKKPITPRRLLPFTLNLAPKCLPPMRSFGLPRAAYFLLLIFLLLVILLSLLLFFFIVRTIVPR